MGHVRNAWQMCPVAGLCALKSCDEKNLTQKFVILI